MAIPAIDKNIRLWDAEVAVMPLALLRQVKHIPWDIWEMLGCGADGDQDIIVSAPCRVSGCDNLSTFKIRDRDNQPPCTLCQRKGIS